ncbi:MAG: PhoH family protein [Bacteroidales bacterium]|nr:PhoH family protein [Bacteroidales bacterium]
MSEKIINLGSIDLRSFFGIHHINLDIIRTSFSKLKIVSRGETLKLIGDENEIMRFEVKLKLMISHFEHYNQLTQQDIQNILNNQPKVHKGNDEVILYGKDGNAIKAQTANQIRIVESYDKYDLIFAIGPAGTGKTYTAVALAVRALKNKEIKRIIITRPAVEAGENLGFLPGDMKEKLDPYMRPLYDALRDMIPAARLAAYIDDGIIEIAPLAYMRGRTLNNVCAILDEAQNCTENQLKMFLTRMGKDAKFIVTGDITQIDIPKSNASGLIQAAKILKDINGIEFIYLDHTDIIRHKLVPKIVDAYAKYKS